MTEEPEGILLSSPLRPTGAPLQSLLAQGEVQVSREGLTSYGAQTFTLLRHFEETFEKLALKQGAKLRRYPSLLPAAWLAKTDYFCSFPQHASFAQHLRQERPVLETFVQERKAGVSLSESGKALVPDLATSLAPAVCYHCYAELTGQTLEVSQRPQVYTASGRCYRFEEGGFLPLRRQWEFTMQELIFVGSEEAVLEARLRLLSEVVELTRAYQLSGRVEVATDPFFGVVDGRTRKLLQRAKQLKYELQVFVSEEGTEAIASFNFHGDYFGKAFDIRYPEAAGEGLKPVSTACVAFGLDRWVAAFVAHHGADPRVWAQVCERVRV